MSRKLSEQWPAQEEFQFDPLNETWRMVEGKSYDLQISASSATMIKWSSMDRTCSKIRLGMRPIPGTITWHKNTAMPKQWWWWWFGFLHQEVFLAFSATSDQTRRPSPFKCEHIYKETWRLTPCRKTAVSLRYPVPTSLMTTFSS